jgi:hypothetical protein
VPGQGFTGCVGGWESLAAQGYHPPGATTHPAGDLYSNMASGHPLSPLLLQSPSYPTGHGHTPQAGN